MRFFFGVPWLNNVAGIIYLVIHGSKGIYQKIVTRIRKSLDYLYFLPHMLLETRRENYIKMTYIRINFMIKPPGVYYDVQDVILLQKKMLRTMENSFYLFHSYVGDESADRDLAN